MSAATQAKGKRVQFLAPTPDGELADLDGFAEAGFQGVLPRVQGAGRTKILLKGTSILPVANGPAH